MFSSRQKTSERPDPPHVSGRQAPALRGRKAIRLARYKLAAAIACCLFLSAAAVLALRGLSSRSVHFSPAPMTEDNRILSAPYCGFYHLYGYTLSEKGTEDAEEWCRNMLANDSQSIVLLEINLKNYANETISDRALKQLDTVLSSFSGANRQIILRFLYDWDGNALRTEPAARRWIESHMEQIAPAVNRHSSHVFLMQGVFTGNCGEMNQTHYGTGEDITALMGTLYKVISDEIFLSVRTPQHLRTIAGQRAPLTGEEAYSGTLRSRLGLYNDGMLGNEFDCGTYDDTPLADTADYTEKGTREEELAFQNELCRYVPNGGEAVLDNPLNDLDASISDLAQMRVSYLSCDHDASVLDKWRASVYEGAADDVFHGVSGYHYIAAHLGYRFVVRRADASLSAGSHPSLSVSAALENTGFSPSYRRFEIRFLLRNDDSGQELSCPVGFDSRTLMPGEEQVISTSVPAPETGGYSVTLSVTDPATGLTVPLANSGAEADGTLVCGQLTVH